MIRVYGIGDGSELRSLATFYLILMCFLRFESIWVCSDGLARGRFSVAFSVKLALLMIID